jgi:hypothetical protein
MKRGNMVFINVWEFWEETINLLKIKDILEI